MVNENVALVLTEAVRTALNEAASEEMDIIACAIIGVSVIIGYAITDLWRAKHGK